MKRKQYIHPIALDLGAKHTGVFTAQYESGHQLGTNRQINQNGYVYNLEKDKYTLLMVERTQARHQRRGYDRKQMLKRLFKLIWEKHFGLEWNCDAQKTISFLLNRRGFSFLSGEYDADILTAFPDAAYKLLPSELKINGDNDDEYHDFDAALQVWSKNQSDLDRILNAIKRKQESEQSSNASVWKFTPSTFNLEKKLDDFTNEKKSTKTHLHHLAYAIHKTKEELSAGARHRSKYFEDVHAILSNQKHTDGYLKAFQANLQKGKFGDLNIEKLAYLIGNLSNLELRPLRKYFNDEKHRETDYWNEQRFAEKYFKWILQHWRVNPVKDKDKAAGEKYDYSKLKDRCVKLKNNIIEFLLTTDPRWTIPPYQDNNNRQPPKCQSLILNPKFLDNHYPDWQKWLKELQELTRVKEYLEDFIPTLQNLKTGSNRKYFANKDKYLSARVLQFIFDRVKTKDPLQLNEIYSHTKKLRQQKNKDKPAESQKTKQKLEDAIKTSEIPTTLKSQPNYRQDDLFTEGSFLHLICKYYKFRQRARDSRIFIHPEYSVKKRNGKDSYQDTGNFDDADSLLTYCNRKPRYKRYQLLNDIAGLLQVQPKQLRQHIGIDESNDNEESAVNKWLSNIKGLKTNAEKAAKAQKEHGGNLAIKITDIKNTDKELRNLCDKATHLHSSIYKTLDIDKECDDRVRSVYFLSQIYNIAFKDRSGNANTCSVCSADNAQRMQIEEGRSKAQYLPAITTRIIDGAVKRISRIISNAILENEGHKIEEILKSGNDVRVPIITESNRFEFEPNLKELKNQNKKSKIKDTSEERITAKDERIKTASHDCCPYTGNAIGDEGEIDHIIPRTSSYGIMNDEANLIYASKAGNNKKSNKQYTLKDLSKAYLSKQFQTTDVKKISEWIEQTIAADAGGFLFGRYRSFINLNPDQQKAFRHALFLEEKYSLHDMVIREISNRNRAFVNGTQRFLAQVLAGKIYQRAKSIGKEKQISFDYFGVRTVDDSYVGVSQLRKKFEAVNPVITKYQKGDYKQQSYSHLIDAQLAFCIALDAHKNNGSFKIDVNEHQLLPEGNANTIFDAIMVDEQKMQEHNLERRKPSDGFSAHRSFTRDTIYALNYLPILLKMEGDNLHVRAGFTLKNSTELKKDKKGKYKSETHILQLIKYCNIPSQIQNKQFTDLQSLYSELGKHQKFVNQMKSNGCYCLAIKKERLHEHLIEKYNLRSGTAKDEFFKFCIEVSYRTETKTITTPEHLSLKEKELKIKTQGSAINLPASTEWQTLKESWDKEKGSGKDFNRFLRDYFLNESSKHAHQKARKVFSLPVVTTEGRYLLSRKPWQGSGRIYQVLNGADPREGGNELAYPAYDSEGNLVRSMANWAKKSKNMIEIAHKNTYSSAAKAIDPKQWWLVANKNICDDLDLPDGVSEVYYRVEDNTRPLTKLVLDKDGSTHIADKILQHPLCKARYTDSAQEKLVNASPGEKIIYKGDTLAKIGKEYLRQAFLAESSQK